MHRLFTISDILTEICEVLLYQDGDKASVARLARTNTALSTPCFAALWRKLDCLYPLLNALPSSVIDLSARWRLLRHPTLTDWNRPRYYGAFVRSISYDPNRSPIDRSFFFDLLASLRLRPCVNPTPGEILLLPNLTHAYLTWRLGTPDSILTFSLFYSPTLLYAGIDSTADPTLSLKHQHRFIFALFFGSLQHRCPLLEEIDAKARWSPTLATIPPTNLHLTLPHFPKLRSMSTVCPGEYAIRFTMACAAQPFLKKLSLKFTTSALIPTFLPVNSFPALEVLQIEGYTQKCSDFATLLAACPPPNLASIRFTCLSLEQPTIEFFKAVASAAPRQALRSLSLFFHPNYESQARTTLCDLSPLFIFDELRELRIQAGNPFHIGPGALDMIGVSFPELRVLCLNSPGADEMDGSPNGGNLGSSFSWSSVVGLAKTCRSLRELSLPLDFDSLPSLSPARPSIDRTDPPSSPPTSSKEMETFPSLESFLINDLPSSSSSSQPLLLPTSPTPHATTLLHNALFAGNPPSPAPLQSNFSPPSPPSRAARNSIPNPKYVVLALLIARVFPRAKLGMHISQFELHGEQQRMERFLRVQLRASAGRLRRS